MGGPRSKRRIKQTFDPWGGCVGSGVYSQTLAPINLSRLDDIGPTCLILADFRQIAVNHNDKPIAQDTLVSLGFCWFFC